MRGLLGGTFNPVHWGHVRLALHVGEVCDLDTVELVPCAVPPHKPSLGLLPFDLRVGLLQTAIAEAGGAGRLEVNTLEARLPGPSYTWNLIHAWRAERNEVPLFILGDEDFAGLDLWHRGLELPTVTDLLIIGRAEGSEGALFRRTVARFWPQASHDLMTGGDGAKSCAFRGGERAEASGEERRLTVTLAPGRRCWFLPVPKVDVSSSLLRDTWRKGGSIRELTPAWRELEQQRETVETCWREAF